MKKAVTALVAAAVVAAGALNIPATASAKTSYDTDYSRAGYGYVSVGAADFLERVLGENLSAAEREYLDENSDFALNYNNKVAGKYVQSEYRQASGELTVTPSAFSYEAVNGKTVTWAPVSVNGGELASGTWNTTITEDYTEDFVTVSYNTSFTVAYGDVNNIINKYCNAAKSASEKLASESAKYEKAYAEYVEKHNTYQQYLADCAQYQEDLAAYNEYVIEFRDWSIKNNLYQNYLVELAEYEKEQKAYENYQQALKEYNEAIPRYQQYLTDKANYDRLYAEYHEKMDDPRIAKELSHIEILDYIFTPVVINGDNARTLYGAVMGGSVDRVFSNLNLATDSALSVAKIIRETVNDALGATKNLRDLFTKLNACKTDEDKYIFYISTYESLKSNLSMLMQTLEYFFRNEFIRGYIRNYEGINRELQFQVMLAQLYTVCNALDNNTIGSYYKEHMDIYAQRKNPDQVYDFDGSYLIGGKDGIAPATLLAKYGGTVLPDTNDAVPIEPYVDIPEEPIEPEVVEKPEQPQRVQQPVVPDEVANPGPAPCEVVEPTEPERVENPVEPIAYQPTAEEQKLAYEYGGGTVLYRNELREDYKYDAYCEVEHYFRNAQLLTVAFYLNIDDEVPEWEEEGVQAGGSIEYGGKTPTMTRKGYTCEFAGWKNSDGETVDINSVPSSGSYLKLYPYFTVVPNMYKVIWLVDGVEYRAEAAYDSIPDYRDTFADGDPKKDDDADGRKYRFIGWNKEIKVMTETAVYYEAIFERSFLITFKVNSDSYVVSVWKDEVPEYPGDSAPQQSSDSSYYYTFSGWKRGDEIFATPEPAQRDATYIVQFERHYILDLGSGGAIVELRNGMYEADCTRAAKNTFDISFLAEQAAENSAGIILQMPAYTITFSAEEAYVLHQSAACKLTPSLLQTNRTTSGFGTYRYSVELSGLNRASYSGSFTMTAAGYFDTLHSRLYRIDGEEKIETRYTYSSDSITFSMRSGYVYEIYPQYEVNILLSDEVAVTASATVAAEKETIVLTFGEPAAGKFIERLYVLDFNGNEVEVSSDYTFQMPEGDVSVGVVCGFIEYTVVFKSDGATLVTRTYHYGDTVVPPTAFKSPDGEYSYTFVGWDKEIVPVTGNAEYNAVFSAELLPVPEAQPLSQKMQILLWLVNHFILIIVIAAVMFGLFLTGIILMVRHRRKKRKLNKNR